MSMFSVALVSLFVAVGAVGLFVPVFRWFKLLDNPAKYGFERESVPYGFGFVFYLVFCLLAILFTNVPILLLILMGCLVLMAFLDDKFGISPLIRLLVQVVVAILTVLYVDVRIDNLGNLIDLGVFSVLVSVFWIVFLINIMNFLDGVSGLSSGVSSIGFFVLYGLAVMPSLHQIDQSLLLGLTMIMGVLSFVAFVFEFPTPKLLVGDSGTYFYGFMLAVLSMMSGGKLATCVLVLLVPVLDGLWVVVRRFFEKKSPFKGDFMHLHHRLERIGWSKELILIVYMLFSLVFGLIAVFVWNTFFKLISLVVLISILSFLGYIVWIKDQK